MKKPWAIVAGFGNPLMQDDGVGPRFIAYLRDHDLPAGVEVVDAGTSALDLVPSLIDKRLAILIDAVEAGGEAGAIYRFSPDEVRTEGREALSLHSFSLVDAVRLWELQIEPMPTIVVFGVQPQTVELGMDLSPDVEAALPALLKLVLDELRRA